LFAFPPSARECHAHDLLGVLSQSDLDRGTASWRETRHLLTAGLGLRCQRAAGILTPARLIGLAASMTALAALAPGPAWALRHKFVARGHSFYVIQGPTPVLRWALLAAASVALAAIVAHRGLKVQVAISGAAGGAGTALSVLAAFHAPGPHPGFTAAGEHALLLGGALASGVLIASLLVAQLPTLHRVRCAAGCLVLACVSALIAAIQADPPGDFGTLALWDLRPAGILTISTALLGALAMLASQRWHDEARPPGSAPPTNP